MAVETLKFSNGEVNVVWLPKTSQHSTLCWKGLNEVSKPKERPRIKLVGASSERIIEQVQNAPSVY
jgi:hypothetical protein